MAKTAKPSEGFDVGYVVWDDACSEHNRCSHDFFHAAQQVVTAGFIVKESREGLTIAQDAIEDGRFRHQTFVPRSYIRKIVRTARHVAQRGDGWTENAGRKCTVR